MTATSSRADAKSGGLGKVRTGRGHDDEWPGGARDDRSSIVEELIEPSGDPRHTAPADRVRQSGTETRPRPGDRVGHALRVQVLERATRYLDPCRRGQRWMVCSTSAGASRELEQAVPHAELRACLFHGLVERDRAGLSKDLRQWPVGRGSCDRRQRPARTEGVLAAVPDSAHVRSASCSSRLLPMPAGPLTRMSCGRPVSAARLTASSTVRSSLSRPIIGARSQGTPLRARPRDPTGGTP